jgi:membrane-bound lytic murein transglycosylase F
LLLSAALFSGCIQPGATSTQILISESQPAQTKNSSLESKHVLASSIGSYPYLSTVRHYSKVYGVDFSLVLAMIQQESRFNHRAVSRRGAYGLMQLMPETQLEIGEKLGIYDLTKPKNNIRAGVYHLRSLFEAFPEGIEADRLRMVLAAYNAGIGRVLDAQEIVRHLGGNASRWSEVRTAMSMLSPTYSTLHRAVWNAESPSAGYFRDWKQTVRYVDAVVRYQDRFALSEM